MTTDDTAPIREYIETMLPWAHGHQLKGITDYVIAILDRQTGHQADLVRGLGNQEAALLCLSRLNYTARGHKLRFSVIPARPERNAVEGLAGIQQPHQHKSPMGSLDARQKHSGLTDKSASYARAQYMKWQ